MGYKVSILTSMCDFQGNKTQKKSCPKKGFFSAIFGEGQSFEKKLLLNIMKNVLKINCFYKFQNCPKMKIYGKYKP